MDIPVSSQQFYKLYSRLRRVFISYRIQIQTLLQSGLKCENDNYVYISNFKVILCDPLTEIREWNREHEFSLKSQTW